MTTPAHNRRGAHESAGTRAGQHRAFAISAALVGICLAIRLPAMILLGAEAADLTSYHRMADIVLRGENIYHARRLFPYTPLTLPLPVLSLLLAEATGLPFHLTVKLWPLGADCGLTLLVWRAALRVGARERDAVVAALAYACNPVAILNSAFHGNVTNLAVLLAFGGYTAVAGESGRARRAPWVAALLLGLGVAVRSFPVLLVPVFALLLPRGLRPSGAAWFVGGLLPTAIVSLPALAADAGAYLRAILSYSGVTDQGWLAIRRALHVVLGGSPYPPGRAVLLQGSKLLFLGCYGWLLRELARRRETPLALGCLLAWLLFLVVYGGISTQYLMWVLPFGLLVSPRWTAAYSLAAAAAMVAFYLTWFPAVLLGPYAAVASGDMWQWRLYLVTLVGSWGLAAGWLIREVGRFRTRGPVTPPAI